MARTGCGRWGATAVLVSIGLIWTVSASATEYYPPWVAREHIKPKSPSAPPWVPNEKVSAKSPSAPPWVDDDTMKPYSPYNPPWVHCPKHATGLARGGVWGYSVNWRDVDWSQGGWGSGIHQRTQAFSLAVEAKCCEKDGCPADCKRQPPILEYFRDPPTTGPGRPKGD